MTQEEKDLLLKYLCMALPYKVQVLADIYKTFDGGIISEVVAINLESKLVYLKGVLTPFRFDEIKLFLRPLFSMIEEEKKEHFGRTMTINIVQTSKEVIDWLLKNHFDFMELIPQGLAIEVTKDNNPYKK